MQEDNQQEVQLLALPVLQVLSMLCHHFTIYCAAKNYSPPGPAFLKSSRGALIV